MEILLWLVPSLVVTVLAMLWAGWRGRDTRREVDPEVATQRMARALAREQPSGSVPARRDRRSGIAVRPSR